MAAPSVASVGARNGVNGGSSFSLPNPSGVIAGSLVIAHIGGAWLSALNAASDYAANRPSSPGSQVDFVGTFQDTVNGVYLGLFAGYHYATGTETTSPTVSLTGSPAFAQGSAERIAGGPVSGSPWAVPPTFAFSNVTGTSTPDLATTVDADTLALWVGYTATTGNTGSTLGLPSGFTLVTGGNGQNFWTASKQFSSAGSTGPIVATTPSTGTRAAMLLLLKPPSTPVIEVPTAHATAVAREVIVVPSVSSIQIPTAHATAVARIPVIVPAGAIPMPTAHAVAKAYPPTIAPPVTIQMPTAHATAVARTPTVIVPVNAIQMPTAHAVAKALVPFVTGAGLIVTLTPVPDAVPPMMTITIEGAVGDYLTVTRFWAGQSATVRGATHTPVLGETLIFDDTEAPFGIPVYYQVSTFTASRVSIESTQTASDVLAVDVPWVQDPIAPRSSTSARMSGASLTTADHIRPGGVIGIAGSKTPVGVSGTRQVGSSIPLVFLCYTVGEHMGLKAVLTYGDPLLIRTPPTTVYGLLPALAYVTSDKVTEEPLTWQSTEVSRISMTATLVAAPSASIVIPTRTYADALAEAGTYAEALGLYPTYLEALRGG